MTDAAMLCELQDARALLIRAMNMGFMAEKNMTLERTALAIRMDIAQFFTTYRVSACDRARSEP